VSNILRRLPLSRLLLLCAAVVAIGAVAAALATALGTGPTPPPKPLADAIHDSLAEGHANPVAGVSARIEFTNHLIEGTSLASQGGGSSLASPLLTGASGRLWISADGRLRVELQSERGDTEIFYDGHTVSMYDGSSNSLYRYTPPQESAEADKTGSGAGTDPAGTTDGGGHGIPTVAEIQEAIVKIMRHANLSGAIPTDVAGQAAYAVRISPSHDGGLVGGAELAWDATHGVPLRLAVYSTQSATAVLELTATEISYGAIPDSVFSFSPPAGAKVTEVEPPRAGGASNQTPPHEQGLAAVQAAVPFTLSAPATLAGMERDEVRGAQMNGGAAALVTYGKGLGGIAVLESKAKAAGSEEEGAPSFLGDLPKVALPGTSATELPTPLGTLMRFERGGVAYILAGSVTPAMLQEAAEGL
jgi:outer membrane lipoprotein-sorting protein